MTIQQAKKLKPGDVLICTNHDDRDTIFKNEVGSIHTLAKLRTQMPAYPPYYAILDLNDSSDHYQSTMEYELAGELAQNLFSKIDNKD
jgi:hypothetical protein